MAVDASPDSKCPICLDTFDNVAYLDNCWHRFCFRCVQDRSKTKAECPLCKLPFVSIFHTIRADNDFQEYKVTPSEEAALSSLEGSTIALSESPANLYMYYLYDYCNYATPSHDEGSGSDSTVTPGSEHSLSVSGVGQSPWDDETPGPSYATLEKYGATAGSLRESLENSDKDSAWKRIRLQPQLQAGDDSSAGDSSSENCDIAGWVNLYAERTPEATDLSLDSEESIRKKKYVKKEQSVQRLSRKRKTGSPQASPQNSDNSHGHGPCRKCHSEHQPKKRRSRNSDGSKHRSKTSRRSRRHGKSLSLKSQRGSRSRENTATRDSSRSLAHHKGHGQRRSSSQDSDHHYRRGCYCSGYKCDYPSYSQKTARDSPSCRKRTHSKARCSKKPAGPEFSIQPSTETTDLHSQMGLDGRQDPSYKQCRSRSRSSSRSRSPSGEADKTRSKKPGGKRKCSTLGECREGEHRYGERILEKTVSTSSDCHEYKGSLSDNQASSETGPKKKKKRMRSRSVESRVCEGGAADTMTLPKKDKKHQKRHQKFA
uniref:E3 ubiquitin-protein ligase Topors n=1 Tax=Pavo cristatus TaxID=9049 RepID=A0A8C9FBD2_PAVCR